MSHLHDLNSIDDLNKWVAEVANSRNFIIDHIRNVMEANITGTLGRFFGPLRNAQVMRASGNNNDCLIHSFLSCCSSNFRRLKPVANKNAVATMFRRELLPWFVDNGLLNYNKDSLMAREFLDDNLGQALADKFKVNILFVLTAPERGAILKGCRTDEFDTTIVIHGDRTHFTPVKISDHENYLTEVYNAQMAMSTALGNITPENTPRPGSGGFRKTKRRRGGNRKSKKYRRATSN